MNKSCICILHRKQNKPTKKNLRNKTNEPHTQILKSQLKIMKKKIY